MIGDMSLWYTSRKVLLVSSSMESVLKNKIRFIGSCERSSCSSKCVQCHLVSWKQSNFCIKTLLGSWPQDRKKTEWVVWKYRGNLLRLYQNRGCTGGYPWHEIIITHPRRNEPWQPLSNVSAHVKWCIQSVTKVAYRWRRSVNCVERWLKCCTHFRETCSCMVWVWVSLFGKTL